MMPLCPVTKKSILYNFALLSQEFTNPNLKLANQPGFKGQSELKLELYFWISEEKQNKINSYQVLEKI